MRKPYFLHSNGHVQTIPCSSAYVISEAPSISNQFKRAGSKSAANLIANMVKMNTVSQQVSTDKPEEKKIYCIWPSTDKYSINLKINLLYWSCTHALTSLCDCRFDNSLCHLQMPFYLHFLALEFRNQYIVYTSPGTWLKVQFSLLNHSLSRFPVFVVAVGDHINMQTWIFKKVKSVDDCSFGFCKSTTGSSYEWIGS